MTIERSLPENRQRHLDQTAQRWQDIIRRRGSARDFLRAAHNEYALASKLQVGSRAILGQIEILALAVEAELAQAIRIGDSANRIADEHAEATKGRAKP